VIALSIAVTAFFLVVWGVAGLAVLFALRHSRRARTDSAAEWERNVRGVALLKNWLSPAQLQSYEKFGYFDVIGSDSGILYRIHHGQQANVEQLDGFGQTVCAWCFVPVGDLVAGDVMLAQKVALENDERAAMSIAVKFAALGVRRRTSARPPPLPVSPLGIA
jgi:hypothetical protein